jgi:hypothetical protein
LIVGYEASAARAIDLRLRCIVASHACVSRLGTTPGTHCVPVCSSCCWLLFARCLCHTVPPALTVSQCSRSLAPFRCICLSLTAHHRSASLSFALQTREWCGCGAPPAAHTPACAQLHNRETIGMPSRMPKRVQRLRACGPQACAMATGSDQPEYPTAHLPSSGPAVDRVRKCAAPVPAHFLRPQVRLWNNKVVRLPQEMVHLLPRSLPRFAFLAHRAPDMVSTKGTMRIRYMHTAHSPACDALLHGMK